MKLRVLYFAACANASAWQRVLDFAGATAADLVAHLQAAQCVGGRTGSRPGVRVAVNQDIVALDAPIPTTPNRDFPAGDRRLMR